MTIPVTNPEICTIYDRSDVELEEFLCFCVAVAGKTARVIQSCMFKFWAGIECQIGLSPFELLRSYSPGEIARRLKVAGIGCHTLKGQAMHDLAFVDPDLRTITAVGLEKFHGIGRKTSRFFLLHSRENAGCACLDVHILRWLREEGVETKDQTPSSAKEYNRLEQEFLRRVPKNKTVAEFDLEIWNKKSRKIATSL